MVHRATTARDVTTTEIIPILNLCQLYWDTDALLIQACGQSRRPHYLARVFYVPEDADAIELALDTRFMVQEEFAMLDLDGPERSLSLQIQSQILFRPGLKASCTQNACTCSFDRRYLAQMSTVVGRLRKHVSYTHDGSICDRVR